MLVKLKTFSVLTECGSYTETAKKLYCTQPAVSQHIRFLEKHYQTKLVTRKNQQIVLTERGALLKEYTEKIMGLCKELDDKMTSAEEGQELICPYTNEPVVTYN